MASQYSNPKSSAKPPLPPLRVGNAGPTPGLKAGGRTKTEEEKRNRNECEAKKAEEKMNDYQKKAEEKRKQMMKKFQADLLQRTMEAKACGIGSTLKQKHGLSGSRVTEGEKRLQLIGNSDLPSRIKKPSSFLCRMKFRNELPDPSAQPKLLKMNTDKDRYTRYAATKLEKEYKYKLSLDPDLGIPLDLLDLRVYNPPALRPPLDREDEELLRDDDEIIPIKQIGPKIKERPSDKGISWLVKTEYTSPIMMDSAKPVLTEKQAKEKKAIERIAMLGSLHNREKQIQAIEESFEAAKLTPMHQTDPSLKPVEVFPLLPDLRRYDDQFVRVDFDSDPTADFEAYKKLERSDREKLESQAILKSFSAYDSDPTKQEKSLAYMVPESTNLTKSKVDDSVEASYSWVREYHWDVRDDDDTSNPSTYLVNFGDKNAQYLPLPRKLILQKKAAKERRPSKMPDNHHVPSNIIVRKKKPSIATKEKGPGESSSKNVN